MCLSFFLAGRRPRPRAAFFVAALVGGTGCESVPSFSYDDASVDATTPGSDGATGDDGASGGLDAANADGSSEAGVVDSGTDSAPTTACLPTAPPPPPGAGCCNATAPCVGLACTTYCGDCQKLNCPPGQYCCAQLKPNGMYRMSVCSPDGMGCP